MNEIAALLQNEWVPLNWKVHSLQNTAVSECTLYFSAPPWPVDQPQRACRAWQKAGECLPPCAACMSSAEARKRRMSGSCWCSPTNIFPLIIFIISKTGAVWCTVTDYHNNDRAQWMAHWKTCFIIRMKLLSVYWPCSRLENSHLIVT